MAQKAVFIRKAIFVVGTASLINMIVMYFLANPHLGYWFQAAVSVFMMTYAVIYDRIPRRLHTVIKGVCLVPVVIGIFLAVYGNLSNADYTEDVVIILGAGLRNGEVNLHLANRLDTAIAYLRRNPNALIIVCGGLGVGQPVTEATAMKRYLTERNIAPERIIIEDQSTTTYENLVFAKEILDRRFPGGFRAVLITNAFHIYRAANVARLLGINVNPLGAPTPWQNLVPNYLREIAAVTHMWIF